MRSALRVYDPSLWIIAHPCGADVMPSDRDGLLHTLVQGIVVIDHFRGVRARQNDPHLPVTFGNGSRILSTYAPVDAQLGNTKAILALGQ